MAFIIIKMNAMRQQPRRQQQFTIVPPAYPAMIEDGFPQIMGKSS
jgi:hypothetical protein